ncbi:cilia- and flagella-associated protein 45-like [Agrilus planipennis]|uniref:Cilia- and flagella-associated protein 45 n=1 Tax=Agrilus planipennis TaxID=224129 RepID=A0A1W4W3B2_AGRPL|nr:cilia- and flagella-associated protein 45-like [Agrilus planipennis]
MATGKVKVVKTTKKAGDHDPKECNHTLRGQYIHYKPARAIEGKPLVKLYEQSGVRDLIVPKRDPLELPGIWPESEYKRLKKQARVITEKERKAMIEEAERKKIQLQDECEERRQMLKKAQLEQKPKPGSTLNQAEDEATKKSLYLLQRAFELRQEQEDEVKAANSIILASKCLAIRQAQLTEKEVIKRELEEEDRRLDMMMEQRRQMAINEEERKRQEQKEKNRTFVGAMMQQIKENEISRLMETEAKEEESRNINRALIAMRREDDEKEKAKREKQKQIREEFNRNNKELEKYKLIEREEEKITEMRVQEFMRKKAEREEQLEREIQEGKAAKEKEIARLRAMQERAADQQAAADELNAMRIQEEVEREWRDKQKAIAKRKADAEEELKRDRARQMEDIRKGQALEIARERQEFFQVAKVQQEEYNKEQEKKRKQREAAVCHRKELLKQINEKELERIEKQKQKFEEGEAIRLEQEIRSLNIKQILKKKVETLKQNNVPKKFVTDVARQLGV